MPPKNKTKDKIKGKTVATLRHGDKRKNLPTVEYESLMRQEDKSPIEVAYERRNRDLDPQFVWRGKDDQDWSNLVVPAPPLYIQEKVHPKVLIDDLLRQSKARADAVAPQVDLFADFNGLPKDARATEFYQHDANWSNRMILGDSLQVMASLAEREGLRGKVQCIYVDPPYGIKFNSNFQWSTTSRDVKDGNPEHITREPEQVKAFRDTWRDGIHSYLTYLRDRLTVARDLLADSGSIFVQIGDENVHRVRGLMDEVFGPDNAVTEILVKKKGSQKSSILDPVNDFILWYSKSPRTSGLVKSRSLFESRPLDSETIEEFSRAELPTGQVVNLKNYEVGGEKVDFRAYPRRIEKEFSGARLFRPWPITNGGFRARQMDPVLFEGEPVSPPKARCWSHPSKADSSALLTGMGRNLVAGRLVKSASALDFKRYLDDFPFKSISNWWDGFGGAPDQIYVVQTNDRIIERCLLMTTDPGDLVLDPTCGSGTTAYVAEQWGRRWITIDTSRVALALARARIMGARYPFYLLADSPEGQRKEAEVLKRIPIQQPTRGDIRHGFVYHRCASITSSDIANNAEIDVIWEKWQQTLEPLREQLNAALKKSWQEWEIPRGAGDPWPAAEQRTFNAIKAEIAKGREGNPAVIRESLGALNRGLKRSYTAKTLPEQPVDPWPEKPTQLHQEWWEARIARQKEIDASIAAKAEFEFLYDKPYEDKSKVRVAGPFTVESVSPHRVLAVDENDNVVDGWKMSDKKAKSGFAGTPDFASVILENLRIAGVQQAHKEDRITFTSLTGWPGKYICAEGRYLEGKGDNAPQRRAAILVGPEFGTVSRPDLVAAAREAADANFDVLIACAFNYDAHSAEFEKLGRIPVLKARMNPDLHMADELKNTGAGNLFVIFGEPDIDIEPVGKDQVRVRVKGVDVFKPQTGEVVSAGPEGIACWFIDTDYNEESFFVRHAYFLGANDPYQSLKTTLKAEIDQEAWESLHSEVSRPFAKPETGRIAVKVINHLGDEVMKVFRVGD
ncbi:DNA methylase N-4/N-6 domain-containing protein [Verrucomicrobia bacterium]|nr:DNA methylase N-4/N-6 domain-containing protein [Verrucomicrobiota bacterium]